MEVIEHMKINKNLILFVVFFALYVVTFLAIEMDWFNTKNVKVVMANKALPSDTVLTKENLYIGKVDIEHYSDSMITDIESVLGKRLTIDAESNMVMRMRYVDEGLLKPTEDHQVFPIPDKWILEIQGSLRRYDLINVTAVLTDKDKLIQTSFNNQPINTNSNTNSNEENEDESEGGDNTGESNNTQTEENFALSELQEELGISEFDAIIDDYVLQDVPTVFVKDGNNTEVRGTNGHIDRINGQNTPRQIELSLTMAEFKLLEKLVANGYQFIFSY